MNSFIELYHTINDFLGTLSGNLVTTSFELIVFTIMGYMLFSEFKKTKKAELKYLGAGFFFLLISKFLLSLSLLSIVFIDVHTIIIKAVFPVMSHFFEITGLIFIGFGFVYPFYQKSLNKYYILLIIKIVGVFIISSFLLFHWINIVNQNNLLWYKYSYQGYLILEVIKLLVIFFTVDKIMKYKHIIGKYSFSIAFALSIFAIPALMSIMDVALFSGGSKFLKAISHPFPFLAGILLIRVVFLKVVDKAFLKKELSETKEKYRVSEQLNRVKDDFVSTVSHELRTPLTSMKLYISLLLSGEFGKINAKQKKTVDILKSETNRLSALIEDILSLAKLEQKKQTLQVKQADLYTIVEETLYYNMAKKKQIKIYNKIPHYFKVLIDESKFKQIVINLFSNAIKFTEKKGKIIISAKDFKDRWEFIFSDTGKGIAEENIPKLFDKFYQVEHHMIRQEGGTGLGLAIVKRIVDLHKGKIDVKSEIGSGTTFIITFPKGL